MMKPLQTGALVILAGLSLSHCTNSSSTDATNSALTCNAIATSVQTATGTNTIPVNLGSSYIDEITTTVTVCVPGTTNCQTIPDVLVDTGSNGLRLFNCALALPLTQETVSGKGVAECVTYADTTQDWGPVMLADVQVAGEKASSVPIQVVNSNYGSPPSTCYNLEVSPAATGYNGIIGVGLLTADCGSDCTVSPNSYYYGCASSGCDDLAVPLSSQVTNPVSMMPTDNNGVILTLPSVSSSGSVGATGLLTLGIATSTNNTIASGVIKYSANALDVTFLTTYQGSSMSAFIDSGSNAFYFPASDPGLATCDIDNFEFFCPTGLYSTSATQHGSGGSPSNSVSFSVLSANTILNASNPNTVYDNYAGVMSTDFDWGLPFFFNRTIYVGINGKTAGSLGSGPFWAY